MSAPLHVQGLWEMSTMHDPPPTRTTWHSWITHKCRILPTQKNYWMVDVNNRCCPTCGLEVPNEIWGLWKLHNFHMMRYLS